MLKTDYLNFDKKVNISSNSAILTEIMTDWNAVLSVHGYKSYVEVG